MTADTPLKATIATAMTILIVEGVVLALLGVGALLLPLLAGLAAALMLGLILIASGIAGLVSAFATKPHVHFWWRLVSGIAAIVAGVLAILFPGVAVVGLAIVIAAWLFIDGINSFGLAREVRKAHRHGTVWLILSGIVDWILAAVLLFLPPIYEAVALGVIVGIVLIVRGAALAAMGIALRRKAKA